MNGIILIDKPKGYTSFDVVAKMRRLCKTKKIGHAGTLDPMATGVLPILVGNATKFQELLQNSDKEYLATFKLGITTDTEDITGKVLSTSPVKVNLYDIKNVIQKFIGEIYQIPPMYSAIKVNGQKLYELARKGLTVKREPRRVNINFIDLLDFNKEDNLLKILVSCSKGTYIRTLVKDIGEALGCGATLTELKRTLACSFSLSECMSIEEVEKLSNNNSLFENVVPISSALKKYKEVFVSTAQATRFKNGGALDINRISLKNFFDKEIFKVFNGSEFLGLGIVNLNKNQLCVFKLISN